MLTPTDTFRLKVLKDIAKIASFNKSWPVWEPLVRELFIEKDPTEASFELGSQLREVFMANSAGSRTQSEVSSGGAAWECMVAWYLNLVFWGTDVIATRSKKALVPEFVRDALTVTIAQQKTNTESDIIVYKIPNAPKSGHLTIKSINELISLSPLKTDVTVVQCKTNWNDNAQIPMLWDLIYNTKEFKIPHVSLGIGQSPSSFRKFAYSFVTVPTIKKEIKANSLATLRVKNISGGNYWGKPSVHGVASSINEFFIRNHAGEFNGGVKNHVRNEIEKNSKKNEAFLSLNFDELLN